jgi:uncharacterized coiled-coil protein SlyX
MSICRPSPYENEAHRRAVTAQYQVMQELNLTEWDPKNKEAQDRLQEITEALKKRKERPTRSQPRTFPPQYDY